MPPVIFLESPEIWQVGHGPQHPLKPERFRATHELLAAVGALDSPAIQVEAPRLATRNELARFHTPAYVEVVAGLSQGDRSIPAGRYGFGPGDNPVFDGMFDSERRKVGSALQAAEFLVAGECEIAFSISGGLHHGRPAAPYGFCVFNDPAVAIHWLLEQGYRVAYVDIDVHHGDGVQDAFYDSDQVLTISLHQDGRTLFPGTGFVDEIGSGPGQGFNLNLPLPPGTGDEAYLTVFDAVVPGAVARFGPDILVTQLGVDTHFMDPLANLALTTHGQAELFRRFRSMNLPWLALGGGGYHLDVVPRAWTLALLIMADLSIPEDIPEVLQNRFLGSRLHDEVGPGIDQVLEERILLEIQGMLERLNHFGFR